MIEAGSTAEAISALGNILMAAAAIAAAVAAFMGLDTWKKQQIWQRDHDLARRLLVTQFRFRDRLFDVRSPIMYAEEQVPDAQDDEKSSGAGQRRGYVRRLSRASELGREREALLVEADAIWGSDLRQKFDETSNLERELYQVVRLHIDAVSHTNPAIRASANQMLKQKRDILFDLGPEDEFNVEYNDAMRGPEGYLREKLGRQR